MNRFVVTLFAVVMLWGGCSESSDEEPLPQNAVIAFACPEVERVKSRASGAYPQTERFRVNARYTPREFTTWDDPQSVGYMTDVEMSYDPKIGAWTSSKPYYWPHSGFLSFAAYSLSKWACPTRRAALKSTTLRCPLGESGNVPIR